MPNPEYKLVVVVRADLQLTAGQVGVQCSHATKAALEEMSFGAGSSWEFSDEKVVVLSCAGYDELLRLEARAEELGLESNTVQIAHRGIEARENTTALWIGPGPSDLIDWVTGALPLLS